MKSYQDRFEEAYRRTQRFGLNPPDIQSSTDTLLTRKAIDDMPLIINKKLGIFNPLYLAGSCVMIHRAIKPILENYFSTDVYLTLGSVAFNDKPGFVCNEEYIKDLLKHGIQRSLSLHAWLTLPTMEIIDCTLNTTVAKITYDPRGIGRIVLEKADSLAEKQIVFYPMLIGDELLRRIGIINIMPN